MPKARIKLALSLLAVIAVAVMIFLFSAQEGEESSILSGRVTGFVVRLVVPGFDGLSAAEQLKTLNAWSFYIRKAAHFSEYALLAMTLINFLRQQHSGKIKRMMGVLAWGAAALYACTDEIHQMFVSDRAAALMDVGIDAAGALTGVLLSLLIIWLHRRLRRHSACGEL